MRRSNLSSFGLPIKTITNMYAYEGALSSYLIERNMISLPYQTWITDGDNNLLSKATQKYQIFSTSTGYDD